MENMRISLNFAVDRFQIEEEPESRFCHGTIYAFADGPNAHTHPIDTDVLVKYANTVYDIPVLCRYDKFVGDFLSHEEDEIPIGFIKETSPTYSNPIVFEKQPDGRTFMIIKTLIWKRYSKDCIRALMSGKGRKPVSVELSISGVEIDGKILVKEFVLEGITILGDFVNPAVKDAHIQVEFAKDKQEYIEKKVAALSEGKLSSDIDTEKECAGEYNMNEENTCVSADSVEVSSETNEVVVFAEQDKVDETVVERTDDEIPDKDDPDDDDRLEKDDEDDKDDDIHDDKEDKVESSDMACNKTEDSSATMACNEVVGDIADMGCDTTGNTDTGMSDCEVVTAMPDMSSDKEMAYQQLQAKYEKALSDMALMNDRISELEASNSAYMAKIEAMSDYEELKQYKITAEKNAKIQEDMAKIEAVMSEIENRGVKMSDEDKKTLTEKFSEFNSVDAWSNYVKAQAFDKFDNSTGYVKIALPVAESKSNSIWDRI